MCIKTRFAPSPTGDLHIGNIYTALYAWLFARRQGGKFILRIEDTNSESCVNSNSVSSIISTMKWLNLDWDEGPYFQTNRLHRYKTIIHDMLKNNIAYKCYCSIERLKLLRLTQMQHGLKPKYDGHCRTNLVAVNHDYIYDHTPYVVRFCNPNSGVVSFYDQIRGMITFNNQELDDLVIQRSNGIPTYNFCVVVDDMDMNITHIIRGEEHINNTPRQINILNALHASIPKYAHVPMILNKDRKKLSKRHAQSGIMQYRADGFLPEAILNYLVRLGWSYGNQEIFSVEQMKKYFDFNKINKSASIFDLKKLLWFNHYYLNHLSTDYIVSYLSEYIHGQPVNYKINFQLSNIIELFAKRSNTLKEMMFHYFCLCENFDLFEKKVAKKYLIPDILNSLEYLRKKLNNVEYWTVDSIKIAIKETVNELKINMSAIGMPVRVALTGTDKSPEISIIACVIGKQKVLQRIDQAILYINKIV